MGVTRIEITDSVSQLAPTAKVTTPDGSLDFDETVGITVTVQKGIVVRDLFPNQAMGLNIYQNGNLIEFFRGYIEFVDDGGNADTYDQTVDASPLLPSRPWEQKTSYVWNYIYDVNSPFLGYTSLVIFGKICNLCGCNPGQFDPPNVNGVGTFEVDNQSPIEVGMGLAEPWNKFEFIKYYPRITGYNTLNVVGFHFEIGNTANAYQLSDIISFKRTKSAYIPSIRVGNQNIFLTGGQTTGGLIPNNVIQPSSAILSSSSKNSTFAPEYGDDGSNGGTTKVLDEWSNVDTYVDFDIELSGDVFVAPGTPLSQVLTLGSQLDFIDSIKIINSRTTNQNTFYFNSIQGLYRATYTTNVFDEVQFLPNPSNSASLSVQSLVPPALTNLYNEPTQSFLQVQTETIEYLYISGLATNDIDSASGGQIPHSKVQTYYLYSPSYQPIGTQVYEYLWIRDSWNLQHVDFKAPDNLTLATAGVQVQNLLSDAALVTAAYQDGYAGNPGDPNSVFNKNKSRMGRFQTLNNTPYFEYQVLAGLYYSDKGFTMDVVDTAAAFNMAISYTDYAGLAILYSLIEQALGIEIGTSYWEETEVICALDFSVCVGMVMAGTYGTDAFAGVCVGLKHIIDSDSALTTANIKQLVVFS